MQSENKSCNYTHALRHVSYYQPPFGAGLSHQHPRLLVRQLPSRHRKKRLVHFVNVLVVNLVHQPTRSTCFFKLASSITRTVQQRHKVDVHKGRFLMACRHRPSLVVPAKQINCLQKDVKQPKLGQDKPPEFKMRTLCHHKELCPRSRIHNVCSKAHLVDAHDVTVPAQQRHQSQQRAGQQSPTDSVVQPICKLVSLQKRSWLAYAAGGLIME